MAADLSAADFEFIRKLVRERSGIVLGDDKRYLIEHRLQPVAERHACRTLAELVVRLRASSWSEVHRQVIGMMTTNETYFFRDGQPFEALVALALPQLIKARGEERRLAIWCAACSTGQEPYSILMVLRERLPQLAHWQVRLVATDLNAEVLARAKAGRYSSYEVNRGLAPAYLARFFRAEGNEHVVSAELRAAVDFQVLNLLDAWPGMPAMDVVFLRNVLIYFDLETKRAILGKVRKILRSDGFLFLGGAETTLNIDDRFERVPFDRAGCYRLRADAISVPSGRYSVVRDQPITGADHTPA